MYLHLQVGETGKANSDFPLYLFCGNQTGLQWTSRPLSSVFISFSSNDENTFGGYEILATATECPQYYYSVSPFGEVLKTNQSFC